VKFIIMQFSPRSVFIPFRSRYPPQRSVLKIYISVSHMTEIMNLFSFSCGTTRSFVGQNTRSIGRDTGNRTQLLFFQAIWSVQLLRTNASLILNIFHMFLNIGNE
jgi:hypothetical protein